MAKRFTDSRKWTDPWFSNLPSKYKLLWIYLLDVCNHAGIFKVDLKMLNFCLDEIFTQEDIVKVFKDRLHILTPEKWFLPKFLEFQYGTLDEACKPHLSVLNVLKRERVSKGLVKGLLTPKDKDKDKSKDKDKVIYIYYSLKGWENNKKWCSQQWGRNKRVATKLLSLESCEDVLQTVRKAKDYFGKKNLEWTLETVLKRYPEISKPQVRYE